MGGAAGEAYSNILSSSGMHPAGVLAREAIQNSVDAKAEGTDKVSVNFVGKALTGKDKVQFLSASGLDQLVPRYVDLKLKEPNALEVLNQDSAALNLLYIEDKGTTGLQGDPADPDSKFYRFLLSLGDGGKEHDEHGTGGSYGYGKSVYSSSSNILTIWAYSRTKDDAGGEVTLLFGCGYFRKHKLGSSHFTGRAWFGEDQTVGDLNAQQVVEPLTGQSADEWAAKLGFRHRGDGDLGTTVLVIDSNLDTKEIVRGVEDWWWPRIVDQLLDVEIVHANGVSEQPRPKKREDLRPFIEAYQVALGKDPPKPKTELRKIFNKLENYSLGALGLSVLDRREDGSYVVEEDRIDSVALVRTPLMVVSYYRQWPTQMPGVVGAFVASDDVDDILRAAEPPAHDRWDHEARRLQEPSGLNRRVVERILGSIKRSLKQFQLSATPPAPVKPKRLSLLERTLASFLSPSKVGTQPGPEANAAPISLTYEVDPTVTAQENGDLKLAASFCVKPKADFDASNLRIKVRATCSIIEDGQAGDQLAMTVTSSTGEDQDENGWFEAELTPETVLRFDCETEQYANSWSVRFVPEVQSLEAK
ncbi:hypothetical protein LC612_29485 [Nostoc sp. CHAB 5834]|nr:hypothetical protein [Nostoc sp. CHAB 5834]